MSASFHSADLVQPILPLPPSPVLTQLPSQPHQLLIASDPVSNNPIPTNLQSVHSPDSIITSLSMNAALLPPLPACIPCNSLFGTKTAYPEPNPLQPLPYSSRGRASSPRLIHVSLVARHGTRNPTNSSIARMEALESWLKDSLPDIPPWLVEWSHILEGYRKQPGMLTCHGERELFSIGYRFASLYTRDLQSMGGNIRIRTSYKERTIFSARAFIDGYVSACDIINVPPRITSVTATSNLNSTKSTPEGTHSILHVPSPALNPPSDSSESDCSSQASTSCDSDLIEPASPPDKPASTSPASSDDLFVEILPLGSDAILRYFERNEEYASFALSHKAQTYKDLARGPLRIKASHVKRRVGLFFGANKPMDIDLVRSVSEAAAFDTAHGRADRSKFCAALTPEDRRVLEALEQRHRPFFKGYQKFRNVCAPLIADLMCSLDASVQRGNGNLSQEAYAIDLRFAHAETLVPVLLRLGIDSNGLPRSHPQYCHGLSGMSPFAANLALELYEDVKEGHVHHFVRFRLNERYITCIPALGECRNGIVPLEKLRQFFRDVVEDRSDCRLSDI